MPAITQRLPNEATPATQSIQAAALFKLSGNLFLRHSECHHRQIIEGATTGKAAREDDKVIASNAIDRRGDGGGNAGTHGGGPVIVKFCRAGAPLINSVAPQALPVNARDSAEALPN